MHRAIPITIYYLIGLIGLFVSLKASLVIYKWGLETASSVLLVDLRSVIEFSIQKNISVSFKLPDLGFKYIVLVSNQSLTIYLLNSTGLNGLTPGSTCFSLETGFNVKTPWIGGPNDTINISPIWIHPKRVK